MQSNNNGLIVTASELQPPTPNPQTNDKFKLFLWISSQEKQESNRLLTRLEFEDWLSCHDIEKDSPDALLIETGIPVEVPGGTVSWQRVVE